MENRFIEKLVNETFTQKDNKDVRSLYYIADLNAYFYPEKNWFFPESIFSHQQKGTMLRYSKFHCFDVLFEDHSSSDYEIYRDDETNNILVKTVSSASVNQTKKVA